MRRSRASMFLSRETSPEAPSISEESGEKVNDVHVRRHGLEKEASMTSSGLALVTEECTRDLRREFDHLRPLGDGLGQLQLGGVDFPELIRAPLAGRFASSSRSPQCTQMHIVDASFGQRRPEG